MGTGRLTAYKLKGPALIEWLGKQGKKRNPIDLNKLSWDSTCEIRESVKKLHSMTDADYAAARM